MRNPVERVTTGHGGRGDVRVAAYDCRELLGGGGMTDQETTGRELERRTAELRARLPKHSVPPAMLLELDELEEALQALRHAQDQRREAE